MLRNSREIASAIQYCVSFLSVLFEVEIQLDQKYQQYSKGTVPERKNQIFTNQKKLRRVVKNSHLNQLYVLKSSL